MTREERMERLEEIRAPDGWILECSKCRKVKVYDAKHEAPPDPTLEDRYCPRCGRSGVELTTFVRLDAPSDLRALLDVAEAARELVDDYTEAIERIESGTYRGRDDPLARAFRAGRKNAYQETILALGDKLHALDADTNREQP